MQTQLSKTELDAIEIIMKSIKKKFKTIESVEFTNEPETIRTKWLMKIQNFLFRTPPPNPPVRSITIKGIILDEG